MGPVVRVLMNLIQRQGLGSALKTARVLGFKNKEIKKAVTQLGAKKQNFHMRTQRPSSFKKWNQEQGKRRNFDRAEANIAKYAPDELHMTRGHMRKMDERMQQEYLAERKLSAEMRRYWEENPGEFDKILGIK